MNHENHICEEDSMDPSTNLGTMTIPKIVLEGKCYIWTFYRRIWKVFIILGAKMKFLSNPKIFDGFHSKLFYFSCSLEKNTPEFRMAIFYFRINSCVGTLKWRATRHSKLGNRNFVPRKCECPLGNSRWLILKAGYHTENPWKTRHFCFDASFGYQMVSWWYPKFSPEKVWDFSSKMTCHTCFLDWRNKNDLKKQKDAKKMYQGCTPSQ